MKNCICCFTGHRTLPASKIEKIVANLNKEIENLIAKGVTVFISGGALGFDQIAASLVIAKKEMGAKIRLIVALPCKNQDEKWNAKQQELHRGLLAEADGIIDVFEEYTEDSVKKCNQYIVDHAAFCICALLYEKSGTGQTVRYARERGLKIINVAE